LKDFTSLMERVDKLAVQDLNVVIKEKDGQVEIPSSIIEVKTLKKEKQQADKDSLFSTEFREKLEMSKLDEEDDEEKQVDDSEDPQEGEDTEQVEEDTFFYNEMEFLQNKMRILAVNETKVDKKDPRYEQLKLKVKLGNRKSKTGVKRSIIPLLLQESIKLAPKEIEDIPFIEEPAKDVYDEN